MRRYLPILIVLFITCSYGASEELEEGGQSRDAITENSFEYIDASEAVATENFTDKKTIIIFWADYCCLLYTSPSPRDNRVSRMPSSA